MAELSFRCPGTGLVTLARGRLLEEECQPQLSFGAMKVRVDYCMGCSGDHVVAVADTLTLDLTSAEILLVTLCCTDASRAVGERIKPNRRRPVRKDGSAIVRTSKLPI